MNHCVQSTSQLVSKNLKARLFMVVRHYNQSAFHLLVIIIMIALKVAINWNKDKRMA